MNKLTFQQVIGATALLALVGSSQADVLCKNKKGILAARTACKGKETAINPAALGLVGPQGAQGTQGPQGAQGAKGDAGPASRWVLASGAGSILAQSGGITVTKINLGTYIVGFGSSVAGKTLSLLAACLDTGCPDVGGTAAGVCGGGPTGVTCSAGVNNPNNVIVFMEDTTNSSGTADIPFYLAAF